MNRGYIYINNGQVLLYSDKEERLVKNKNNMDDVLQQENILETIDNNLLSLQRELDHVWDVLPSSVNQKNVLFETSVGAYNLYFQSLAEHDIKGSIPGGVAGVVSLISAIEKSFTFNERKRKMVALVSRQKYLELHKEKEEKVLSSLKAVSEDLVLEDTFNKYFEVPKDKLLDFKFRYRVFSRLANSPELLDRLLKEQSSRENHFHPYADIVQFFGQEFSEEETDILKDNLLDYVNESGISRLRSFLK